MTSKNFDIDFKNLLSPRKKFRPRKKQKDIIVGFNLKFVAIGSLVSLFLMNLIFVLMMNLFIDT